MEAFFSWLALAPQGAIALLTAVLTAMVAFLVVFLTQWILGRRARTELLTNKLEELYLALNEVSTHNLKRVEEARALISATPLNKPIITGSSTELQGLELHKKIVMLVRLYFPKISKAHQEVFQRNHSVNMLIFAAENGPPLSEIRLLALSGEYRDAVVAMEEELIHNRRFLVKDHTLPTRYRNIPVRSSQLPKTDWFDESHNYYAADAAC